MTSPQNFLLILARDLSEHVSTPIFLVDPQGNAIFYNEPAELLLGRSFEETGPMSAQEWGTAWKPEDELGNPVPVEDLPLNIAFAQHRPAHSAMFITASDGTRKQIEVTAFPLVAKGNQTVGAVAVFWEERRRHPR